MGWLCVHNNKKGNGKSMRKTRRKQIGIIIGLLVMVLVCLFVEVGKRESDNDKGKTGKTPEEKTEQEQTEKAEKEKITDSMNVRVLLMTTGFVSLFHEKIKITSSKPFTVTVDGKEKEYSAGKTVSYQADDKTNKGKKIIVKPSKGAKLKVLSIKRQNICPSYRHTLQVTWNKQGLLLTNKLPLEEYLYAVVPSELSTSNKMEALKVQAVCARSYACCQIQSGRYDKYHADLDDSVACQVYNNIPEDKRSRKAVDDTKGVVLTDKKGNIVQAYYYSTSWGYSASGQDVWNTKSKISYLPEKLQITEKSRKKSGIRSLDLSSEDAFQEFIQKTPFDTYDSDAVWYRWNMTVSQKALSARVDVLLEDCYAEDSSLVLTQTKTGGYRSKPLKSLGTVKKIRVEKREKSGLITEIVLVGKKNVVKVCTQHNIRKVLGSSYETIYYNHGKLKTSMRMLPSAAFFVTDASVDNETSFQFIGGGFGHGTGMSQCGASRMAELGNNYEEILEHYFTGAELKNLQEIA